MEQEKSPPCSLHVPTSFLPASHATLAPPFRGRSKRGHDPDRVPDMVGAGQVPPGPTLGEAKHLENRMPTRENAWKLLCEYTASESLRKHMLAVEACVRAYARKTGADEETWSLAALLHDFDYERWPNQEHSPDQGHPSEGAKILRERGYSEEIVRAILSHADYCNVPRQSALEHTLFACDEIAGFLTACTYVRPSKSILDLEVDSVRRRMKDKLFAKGVSRDDVRKGAEELGIPLEEHIAFCISAMREQADALGLRGTL
jgi:putative nucleotidyltransferase with HDIG domain